MAEYLDVIDENGNLTGETVAREVAHREGIRHRTSHLWLLRKKDGVLQILLQKRSADKPSFPNCYDISSAGHIPAGGEFASSALRELDEELGITAEERDLIICGERKVVWDCVFQGKPFHDRQISRVFMMWCDLEEEQFHVDPVEVDSVRWMDFEACMQGVEQNTFLNCISLEELQMVRKKVVESRNEESEDEED